MPTPAPSVLTFEINPPTNPFWSRSMSFNFSRIMRAGAACIAMLAACSVFAAEPPGRYADRWVWVMSNLLVDDQVDKITAIVERASKSGYNGLVLADYKFNQLQNMPERYFSNVRRLQK